MKCTGKNCPLEFGKVEKCTVHNCEHRTKPKTNFDRITENDEILAKFLADKASCVGCPVESMCNLTVYEKHKRGCFNVFLKWLQQEDET